LNADFPDHLIATSGWKRASQYRHPGESFN
jgi:hypothetical protein